MARRVRFRQMLSERPPVLEREEEIEVRKVLISSWFRVMPWRGKDCQNV